MTNKIRNSIAFIMVFCHCLVFAQKSQKEVVIGNQMYQMRKYNQAETNYRKAVSKNPTNSLALYNKANAVYRQYQNNESIAAYQQALEMAQTKEEKHRIFHNMGNAYMNQKNYSAAVEAYKNALRNNPADDETRYNYALAKERLKNNPDQNQNNQDNQNQDKQNNQDQQQNQKDQNKDQDQNQDQKDNKDQNNNSDNQKDSEEQKEDKQNEQKPDPNQQRQQQSRQQMENMLKALDRHEKGVRERVQQKDQKGQPVQVPSQKDW